jgi:hypothetical protein
MSLLLQSITRHDNIILCDHYQWLEQSLANKKKKERTIIGETLFITYYDIN